MVKRKYPIEEKTIEELVNEANNLLANSTGWLTEAEIIEDDAEGGYFQSDNDD